MNSPYVEIFTDGSSLGNPGPGGYGATLKTEGGRKEISGGFNLTTNNRMELIAAIKALELLSKPCSIVLTSDSRYLSDAFNNGWIEKWQRGGWKTSAKKPVRNADMWVRLIKAVRRHKSVEFRWTRGHAGHAENELCDKLAKEAAQKKDLPDDEGYINRPQSNLTDTANL